MVSLDRAAAVIDGNPGLDNWYPYRDRFRRIAIITFPGSGFQSSLNSMSPG